jgi:AcrR family transcriptional regulator
MPRRGLDADRVVEAAAQLADAHGLQSVTLARVAGELGVRAPSLYNHVDGRDGLLRAVALRGVRELGAVLREAAIGRAGPEALAAAARAYRAYALAHPGRYAATVAAPTGDDPDFEYQAAVAETVEVLMAVLRAWNVEGDEAVHAARAFRSAVHGFVVIEAAGGFGIPVDPNASFERLVAIVAAGLRTRSTGTRPPRPPTG